MTKKGNRHQISQEAAGGKGRKGREIVLGVVMAVVSLSGAGLGVVRCVRKGWPVSVVDVVVVAMLALFSVVVGIPAIAQMRKMLRRKGSRPWSDPFSLSRKERKGRKEESGRIEEGEGE